MIGMEWRKSTRKKGRRSARAGVLAAFQVHPGVEQSVGQLHCYCYRPGYYRLSRTTPTVRAALVRRGIRLCESANARAERRNHANRAEHQEKKFGEFHLLVNRRCENWKGNARKFAESISLEDLQRWFTNQRVYSKCWSLILMKFKLET